MTEYSLRHSRPATEAALELLTLLDLSGRLSSGLHVYLGSILRVNYLARPDLQFGQFLTDALAAEPAPRRIVIVSAFAALQTVLRFRPRLLSLRDAGTSVSVVLGVDLGGTTKEVLQQLSTWNVNITIVRNRIRGHTFHPKVYLLEWENSAKIIVGSNNFTEGGLFRNYEGSACIHYDLPADAALYDSAGNELRRFLRPEGQTARQLTPAYLDTLLSRTDIPTEKQARKRRKSQFGKSLSSHEGDVHAFGAEAIPPPPPLPAELLNELIAHADARRRAAKRVRPAAARRGVPATAVQIYPVAFYMTLPTLQGHNIPGEARIPLAAIELAEEFWGWPNNYTRKKGSRGGRDRVYHEWKPIWRIQDVSQPHQSSEQPVRMYMYENSSDFRFYSRVLVNAGADLGDVVRITRVAEPSAEFECTVAPGRNGGASFLACLLYRSCSQQ